MEELSNYLPSYFGAIAPLVLAGIIAGAGAIGQAFINRGQSKKNREYNRKLAEYQYSKDLEMWERQNAYNAPDEQMQRLKEAGLNPNYIYGSSGGNTGNASVLPKYDAPTVSDDVQPLQLMGALSVFQDMALKQAQIDNVKQKTLTEQQITLIKDAEKMKSLFEVGKADWPEMEKSPYMKKYMAEISKVQLRNMFQKELNSMAQQGVYTRDPLWLRYFNNIMMKNGINVSNSIRINPKYR